MFRVTKTYGHDLGITAAFRQHRADSHCRFIHGYSLAFELVFECQDSKRDERGWVTDFGGLKPIKDWLVETFDHKLLIAADDPKRAQLEELGFAGLAAIRVLERGVGCEAFAVLIYDYVESWLRMDQQKHVHLVSVQVSEHGANSATYYPGC